MKKKLFIMVIAKTQSGKTGIMCAMIILYLQDNQNVIPINNIYIITGLSSLEWKSQTRMRITCHFGDRIYHRGDLMKRFVDDVRGKKNILIIMDEIQIAAKTDQSIYKSFNDAGLLDKQILYENDVKIVEFTATPDATIYDLAKWKDSSKIIVAKPSESYVGSNELLKTNRIRQFRNLFEIDSKTGEISEKAMIHMRDYKSVIDTFTEPMYHIVRVSTKSIVLSQFNHIFRSIFTDLFDYIEFNEKTKSELSKKGAITQSHMTSMIY